MRYGLEFCERGVPVRELRWIITGYLRPPKLRWQAGRPSEYWLEALVSPEHPWIATADSRCGSYHPYHPSLTKIWWLCFGDQTFSDVAISHFTVRIDAPQGQGTEIGWKVGVHQKPVGHHFVFGHNGGFQKSDCENELTLPTRQNASRASFVAQLQSQSVVICVQCDYERKTLKAFVDNQEHPIMFEFLSADTLKSLIPFVWLFDRNSATLLD